MMQTRSKQRLGVFPKLSEYRVQLGWEVSDLARRLAPSGPAERSLYRLENGQPIRLTSVYRVFKIINTELDGTLDPISEIQEDV